MKSTNAVPHKRKKVNSDDEEEIVKDHSLTSAAENFFEALSEAGITHCFVNLGSDHPAMLEAMIKAKQENKTNFPNIITCPSELVALSAALGYAQATGVPQCVIVHVDCGTLAMGQSIHNASVSRVPVLCFAGLSPFTQNGELLGSRTEFIHWLQDVPDQAAIVRQYCRYTGEIKTGRNIKQMVSRALQFATSDPKGPAYLMAAREVLEEHVGKEDLDGEILSSITPSALPEQEVKLIAKSLLGAKRPLVITSYLGRNLKAPALLAELCDKLPITVVEMVGSDVSLRSDHEAYRGVTVTTHPEVLEADVILILDCDVPWIPTAGKPQKGTKVFHLDVDPLKQQMPLFSISATRKLKVGCGIALGQINAFLDKQDIDRAEYTAAFEVRSKNYKTWRRTLQTLESPSEDGVVSVPFLASRLRDSLPQDTIYVLEAVTNAGPLIHHLNLTKPGSLIASGAGGLGWGGGAALGVKLGKPGSFICAIVGDGVYLFSQMESVYWIARRYDIPFLLVVLNNGGWNAPKVSALLVHKDGLSSKSNRRDLNISFDPSPDYPGIAAAAGKAWGKTVTTQSELDPAIKEATEVVQGGKCAVIEVSVPSMWKEN
ncbi:Thiamine pyrophosphate enzyme, C-terminal TPP-binding [Penicillium italicum]|uniref:Thiamine pyrophosphate enzyme, C-terminal TPP-binding n=1 Tax=Penicillium italicum TaxID=40296 RepID=A0A0A2KZT9_PENIT|nr:Thiamine pyrophosphate enzyme, C-terminal TPP-binding [Penicillium italicum]